MAIKEERFVFANISDGAAQPTPSPGPGAHSHGCSGADTGFTTSVHAYLIPQTRICPSFIM